MERVHLVLVMESFIKMEGLAKMVICGFPGIGKSYLYEKVGSGIVSDSDSSLFSWIEVNGEKVRNPNFVKDYLEHILSLLGDSSIETILVSTHKEIRDALVENGLVHCLVIPTRDRRSEFEEIYKKRGNEWGSYIIDNWDSIIDDLKSYKDNEWTLLVELEKGKFLSDLFKIT